MVFWGGYGADVIDRVCFTGLGYKFVRERVVCRAQSRFEN